MITANPNRGAAWIFGPYLNHLFRGHFQAFHLLGEIPETDPTLPLVFMPNHSTWWDGFFVWWLNKSLFQRPFYVMMLAEQLQRFSFFRRLGAYGLDPGNAKSTVQALRYTVERLAETPPPTLCFFPQGELLPWQNNNLRLREGISWISAHSPGKITALPLGIRVEMLAQQRPEVFFAFGRPVPIGEKKAVDMNALTGIMESLLAEMAGDIVQKRETKILFSGKRSLSE
ncbi:MAG TPA: lysophospholipid acyltransferase family protein [Calditrichia bacterium]|nr:lysophospholipid acyltransferase family protein [Calditrichota bacterium]HQU74203.1 lysophospholipid acyltransferase family protein [Calditrichia bacterium]HQV30280.1 lysophospholipid acyltransferase family protein [Calditrichia bacterium]